MTKSKHCSSPLENRQKEIEQIKNDENSQPSMSTHKTELIECPMEGSPFL